MLDKGVRLVDEQDAVHGRIDQCRRLDGCAAQVFADHISPGGLDDLVGLDESEPAIHLRDHARDGRLAGARRPGECQVHAARRRREPAVGADSGQRRRGLQFGDLLLDRRQSDLGVELCLRSTHQIFRRVRHLFGVTRRESRWSRRNGRGVPRIGPRRDLVGSGDGESRRGRPESVGRCGEGGIAGEGLLEHRRGLRLFALATQCQPVGVHRPARTCGNGGRHRSFEASSGFGAHSQLRACGARQVVGDRAHVRVAPLFRARERRQHIRPPPGAEVEDGFDERHDRCSTLRGNRVDDVTCSGEVVARDQGRGVRGRGLDGVGEWVVEEHAGVPAPDQRSRRQAEPALFGADAIAVAKEREKYLVRRVAAGQAAEPGVGHARVPLAGARERLCGLRPVVDRVGALDGDPQ